MPTIEQLKEQKIILSVKDKHDGVAILGKNDWDSIIKVLEAAKQVSYMLHVNDEGYVDTDSAADLAEALAELESR